MDLSVCRRGTRRRAARTSRSNQSRHTRGFNPVDALIGLPVRTCLQIDPEGQIRGPLQLTGSFPPKASRPPGRCTRRYSVPVAECQNRPKAVPKPGGTLVTSHIRRHGKLPWSRPLSRRMCDPGLLGVRKHLTTVRAVARIRLSPGGFEPIRSQPTNRNHPKAVSAGLAVVPRTCMRINPQPVPGHLAAAPGHPKTTCRGCRFGRPIRGCAILPSRLESPKVFQPFDPSSNDAARGPYRRFLVPKYHPLQSPKAVSKRPTDQGRFKPKGLGTPQRPQFLKSLLFEGRDFVLRGR